MRVKHVLGPQSCCAACHHCEGALPSAALTRTVMWLEAEEYRKGGSFVMGYCAESRLSDGLKADCRFRTMEKIMAR